MNPLPNERLFIIVFHLSVGNSFAIMDIIADFSIIFLFRIFFPLVADVYSFSHIYHIIISETATFICLILIPLVTVSFFIAWLLYNYNNPSVCPFETLIFFV